MTVSDLKLETDPAPRLTHLPPTSTMYDSRNSLSTTSDRNDPSKIAPDYSDTASDELLKKLLQANSLEQAGALDEAREVYEEIAAADEAGLYGVSARKALATIADTPPQIPPSMNSGVWESANSTDDDGGKTSVRAGFLTQFPRGIEQQWNNLSFTNKLTVLLVSGAILPVAIVTQGLIGRTQARVEQEFRSQLQRTTSSWEEDYVVWTEDDSLTEAENLARLVRANGINLSDPKQIAQRQGYLSALVTQGITAGDRRADVTKSFRILTDRSGRTLAKGIKIHDSALNPEAYRQPNPTREIEPSEFIAIETPSNANLGDLEIVRQVLTTGQPLRGIELVSGEILSRLGLENQAEIPILLSSSSPDLAPAPIGTYDIDEGSAGLATVVVYPISLNNQLVGTAIVGVLHNRHFALLDTFQQLVDANSISVFAYDWRVNTNVPGRDGTRALGTLAPKSVSNPILDRPFKSPQTDGQGDREPGFFDRLLAQGNEELTDDGKGLFQEETIGNEKYLTYYRPLYNHQKELNPQEAKPIGMLSVGRSLDDLETLVAEQQRLGLLVGGVVLVGVIFAAIPIARAFAGSLTELARFAQKVGRGQTGVRVSASDRADEIGILARELNQMAVGIEANIAAVKQQEQLRREEAGQQRREKEKLQRGVVNLLLEIEGAQRGDLTVNAPVTEGSVGSIADAFNITIRRLRDLVLQVQTAANQVNDLAARNAPSMQQVSQTAKMQASETQETLKTVAQIGDSIRSVDESTQQAAQIAQQGAKAAQEGEDVMDMTVTSIDKISDAVDETASKVNRLTESFGQILQILTLISSIAERTNLLAYNASIEASRAGENGQGFRVVAEEVRRLAGRATEATRSIEQIVDAIQQETIEVQQAMETGKAEVAEGTELVNQTKQTLKRLAEITQTIDRYLQSISQNTTTQARASDRVNQMVEQVSTTTQSTSAEAEAVATSLQDLATLATSLQESVSQFRLER
ncbi:cache domain-containing protein [Oscillatoriales cyanobacterium LEGE 11467]|uniref:Cache domain-containing protein n=1 Tax=Zarconia navalis LEGE 11467 TaxID=1828826 RepID=A0A928VUI2_9CYAN|nr:methyl-accepting chemotaxis protein [Zarconia navalis]MBE9040579.1 cache domain-containing protein [Zarconia navalis LEGE 11467]